MRHITWTIATLGLLAATPGFGQSAPSSSPASKKAGCAAAAAEPATKPAPASADGTAPGNAGSTGWSGGTGGSTIGTSQNGPAQASRSYQPATARGLDPIASVPRPAPC